MVSTEERDPQGLLKAPVPEGTASTTHEKQAASDDSSDKPVESWWVVRWFRAVNQWIAATKSLCGKDDDTLHASDHSQDVKIEMRPGLVVAWVDDGHLPQCQVVVHISTFGEPEWERVIDLMSHQAVYAAQLLNGEMPCDIEQIFRSAGVSLFPSMPSDLRPQCSCSEHTISCKHIMAVYHALGELLRKDPFLLFVMRGRTRQQVMAALQERRIEQMPGVEGLDMLSPLDIAEMTADQSLEASLDTFWRLGPEIDQIEIKVAPPAVEMEILTLLGYPSFVDQEGMIERLAEIYRMISRRALEVAFGEQES